VTRLDAVRRRQVLGKVKRAARSAGLQYSEVELKRHTGVVVGGLRVTISRTTEINEGTAEAFWKQFDAVLGKGWWRA